MATLVRSFPSKVTHRCAADQDGTLSTHLRGALPHGGWAAVKISEIKKCGMRVALRAQISSHASMCCILFMTRMVDKPEEQELGLVVNSLRQWYANMLLAAHAGVRQACTVMKVTYRTIGWK